MVEWIEESSAGTLSDNYTYTMKDLNSSVNFSVAEMEKTIKKLEWLNYEVDPSWAKFCSFGPEDIGSVWEEIGAIRKRPKFDMLAVGAAVAEKMNQCIENQILGFSSMFTDSLYGIPVVHSSFLKDDQIIAFNSANPSEEVSLRLRKQRETIWNNFNRVWP